MINSLDMTNRLAIDTKSIDDLHLLSKQDSKRALQEAAKQFEALFLQMLVKSMRDATLKSGLIDSQQTQFYTEMYDQQMAQSMSAKGIGLADIMVEQLTRTYNIPESQSQSQSQEALGKTPEENITSPKKVEIQPDNRQNVPATNQPEQLSSSEDAMSASSRPDVAVTSNATPDTDMSHQLWSNHQTITRLTDEPAPDNKTDRNKSDKATDFFTALMPHASVASESTGIPAHFMLAQAALESGWGKHEIRHPDNSPSHNLFGIKAGSSWKGEIVETITTEYVNGVPQKTVEKFRAYHSYEEGFRDYANLLSNNPRYAEVINTQNAADFANGLQRAGYATDPQYADKLLRILNNSVSYHQEAI
ncbi:MAG: flagellar assembly peptidoglycan hydrolase FlgJ [Burkholderiales bacterium]|nr:flagellar assembly peptidoglycan hydrolase FlgJ [Burkholderiales bacterium]MDR4518217.1 flagellar assembly peptidoglycan hydrolase FlgJ [Nitrosomonas sp.]